MHILIPPIFFIFVASIKTAKIMLLNYSYVCLYIIKEVLPKRVEGLWGINQGDRGDQVG